MANTRSKQSDPTGYIQRKVVPNTLSSAGVVNKICKLLMACEIELRRSGTTGQMKLVELSE